ncbi:MAG: hypothetical protein K9H61_04220 [Bacteroidia bacterium]|nr:hypothetical protein [Bacteroidia bacterium]MCF8426414.1 hypothetical protein [Bacteroidia bacterium]MCF8446182.1 hypothetical protein [Bacteroidia bacterium]
MSSSDGEEMNKKLNEIVVPALRQLNFNEVMVKVVDILGIDTSKIIEVNIK